jgi:pimeloyl-ACP methyl ester carboxylesterase
MERSLVSSLHEKGWQPGQISVLPVQRSDWLQVFLRGALDLKFWQGDASPTGRAFSWYLERVSNEISSLGDDEKVVLVGHSAGGWLGRAALGFGSADDDDNDAPPVDISKVVGMVTLGSPHLPPPPDVVDATRGALRITHERFPGNYHSDMFYITAMGLAVQGAEQKRKSPLEPTSLKGFAYTSYKSVCGDGTTVGDGVVPKCSGHLEGALQLDLEGVLHSINAPDSWYGSSGIIDRWHGPMLEQLADVLSIDSLTKWQFQVPIPFFSTKR